MPTRDCALKINLLSNPKQLQSHDPLLHIRTLSLALHLACDIVDLLHSELSKTHAGCPVSLRLQLAIGNIHLYNHGRV